MTIQRTDHENVLLHINKTEIVYKTEDGKYVWCVRESAKTDAGNRTLILDSQAIRILTALKAMNPFEEYIFMENGERVKGTCFSRELKKFVRKWE